MHRGSALQKGFATLKILGQMLGLWQIFQGHFIEILALIKLKAQDEMGF